MRDLKSLPDALTERYHGVTAFTMAAAEGEVKASSVVRATALEKL